MLLGGLTYLCYRPPSLRLFSWFEAMGLQPLVIMVRRQAAAWTWEPPSWWIGSAPAALWLLSGLAAYAALWGGWAPRGARLWMGALIVAALAGELGQLAFVPGTFDPIDLLVSVLTAAIFLALARGTTQAPCPETFR